MPAATTVSQAPVRSDVSYPDNGTSRHHGGYAGKGFPRTVKARGLTVNRPTAICVGSGVKIRVCPRLCPKPVSTAQVEVIGGS